MSPFPIPACMKGTTNIKDKYKHFFSKAGRKTSWEVYGRKLLRWIFRRQDGML
jgi:hypothetical protein